MKSAEDRVSPGATASNDVRGYKLYSALKYVPVVLFALFVILIFVAFALPVASYVSVNSGIAPDSPGNIYTALSGLLDIDDQIHDSVMALFVFAPIAVAYMVFSAVTCFNRKFGVRGQKDSIGATFAGNVCSGLYTLYIIFMILALVILSRIFIMDNGLGVIKLGAATVTILIGIAVFVVISIICEVMRWHMEKTNGELRAEEQRRLAK